MLKILFGNVIFTDNFVLENVIIGQYESDNINDPNIDTYFKIIYKYNDLKIIINCGKKMKIKEKNIIFKMKNKNLDDIEDDVLINDIIDYDDNIIDYDKISSGNDKISSNDDKNLINDLCVKKVMENNIFYIYNFDHEYGYLTDYYNIFLDCYNNNKNCFISPENMELYWQNVNNIKKYIENNNIKPFIY